MEWKPGEHARILGRRVNVARFTFFVAAGLGSSEMAFLVTQNLKISGLAGVVVACAFDEARMSGKDK